MQVTILMLPFFPAEFGQLVVTENDQHRSHVCSVSPRKPASR